MKTAICTVLCLSALASAFCQEAPTPPVVPQPPRPTRNAPGAPPAPAPPAAPSTFSERLKAITEQAREKAGPEQPGLTRFSLDFPGGTPKELVAAIEKAMGRPLNAIVPEELVDTRLPALRMNRVDVSQLFQALAGASRKSEAVITGGSYGGGFGGFPSYQIVQISCGFRQGSEGKPSDDSIWYFYVEKPVLPPLSSSAKSCRFYALAPYLDRGLTVDDITTAIKTGWEMMGLSGAKGFAGEASQPNISFHKDTKLLIAVGEPSKLETIDAVLKALEASPKQNSRTPGVLRVPMKRPAAPPGETPAEKPKTDE
jgi:hypothetical protein